MKHVALTMRMAKSDYGEWRDCIAEDWVTYLHAQNIELTLVPNDPSQSTKYLEGSSALILTGGDDIVLQSPDNKSDDPRALRDQTEYTLLKAAIDRKIPVLGICRGMQLINFLFGGNLKSVEGHVAKDHEIKIIDDSSQNLFPKGNLTVNSFHNLEIENIGKDLQSFAEASDGTCEGFAHSPLPIIGIMWHPERFFSDSKSGKMHSNLILNFISSHS